jgi:hypothetical protein
LYFQKKRPPFSKRDPLAWDAVTDHAIVAPTPASTRSNDDGDLKEAENEDSLSSAKGRMKGSTNHDRSNWVPSFF